MNKAVKTPTQAFLVFWKNHEPVLTSADVFWWQVGAKLMRPFLGLIRPASYPSSHLSNINPFLYAEYYFWEVGTRFGV